ncbi:hypothetical protein JXA12_05290 [Candidatus Woesearchaeota archaeon]|nr:hypothetical protein [Candidatus Woesearchaeota archaeon]
MRTSRSLPLTLVAQLLFLGLVLTTTGPAKMAVFALFWLTTIATLFVLVNREWWRETSWIAFGALCASLIVGVLLSTHALEDPVGVGVSVMGLLLVAAALSVLPTRRKRRTKPQRGLPDIFYSIPGSEKYHRKGCRMLTDRDDLEGYASEAEARRAGKTPCRLCH